MANLERTDFKYGQTPEEIDWEQEFNKIIDYINAGIPPGDLQKTAGKVAIDISGDAATLNGKTADQIAAGDFPEVKKTLIDVITGGSGLVLSGGVATKNGGTANQLDITAVKVIQKVTATGYIDRVELDAAAKTTTLANQTYYLDVVPGASDYSWDTSHPAGDYVTLATVTTDSSANIATVLDTRPLFAKLLDGMDAVVLAEDFVVGDVDQSSAPTGNITKENKTGIKSAFSWIANRIKAITGKTNWWDTPVTTIEQLNTDVTNHTGSTSNPHSVDYEQTGAKANLISSYSQDYNGDPNITLLGHILTNHANIPSGDTFFHIITLFYGSIGAERNRSQIAKGYAAELMYIRHYNTGVWSSWKKVWTEDNDGAGSGLDADTVDNKHADDIFKTVTGQYTGDGTNSRVIDLGFTPRYIEIWNGTRSWQAIGDGTQNLHHISKSDVYSSSGDGTVYRWKQSDVLFQGIVTNGFKTGSDGTDTDGCNVNGYTYIYKAWR